MICGFKVVTMAVYTFGPSELDILSSRVVRYNCHTSGLASILGQDARSFDIF